MKNQPNILLLVLDACRARNLSCYGYSKTTSPVIDRIAEEGVLFNKAFSCANFTSMSLTSIFSGKYPPVHGITHHGVDINEEHAKRLQRRKIKFLAEFLKNRGYKTIAVQWPRRWFEKGYDYFGAVKQDSSAGSLIKTLREFIKPRLDTLPDFLTKSLKQANRELFRESDAEDTTDTVIDFIEDNKDEKFFLYAHYWDTHRPYKPPEKYQKQFNDGSSKQEISLNDIIEETCREGEKNFFKRWFEEEKIDDIDGITCRYNGEINYVDHEIGRIIDALKKLGILDDTLIIITADHGESLLEHGIYCCHTGLFDVSVHVPLIFRWGNGLEGGKKIDSLVSHVDLVPTILDLVEGETNKYFDGKSVLSLIEGEEDNFRSEIYLQEKSQRMAIRTQKYKYITEYPFENEEYRTRFENEQGRDAKEQLYNLQTDPEETENIIGESPEKANEMKNELNILLESFNQKVKRFEERGQIKKSVRKLKEDGKI